MITRSACFMHQVAWAFHCWCCRPSLGGCSVVPLHKVEPFLADPSSHVLRPKPQRLSELQYQRSFRVSIVLASVNSDYSVCPEVKQSASFQLLGAFIREINVSSFNSSSDDRSRTSQNSMGTEAVTWRMVWHCWFLPPWPVPRSLRDFLRSSAAIIIGLFYCIEFDYVNLHTTLLWDRDRNIPTSYVVSHTAGRKHLAACLRASRKVAGRYNFST